jgi:hypothetical protein
MITVWFGQGCPWHMSFKWGVYGYMHLHADIKCTLCKSGMIMNWASPITNHTIVFKEHV